MRILLEDGSRRLCAQAALCGMLSPAVRFVRMGVVDDMPGVFITQWRIAGFGDSVVFRAGGLSVAWIY